LRGVEAGRDFEARFADLRQTQEHDTCPECGGALRFQTAIEVGHIFKLETFYSVPLDATFLDEDGAERPLVMGSYGIGPGRIMAAAVEQSHDEHGIVWPRSIAPYDVHVVTLPGLEEQGDEVAGRVEESGRSVLLDDREQRAGEKFADADLIGCPLRVTVGKKTLEDGAVDVRNRATGEERRVAAAEIAEIR
jgi:prolyl-tRNA synthetase